MTLPGFEKGFFSTSKNVTIFLELGTNVTILSYCHIIFLGSAWNKTEFQNLARSWVLWRGLSQTNFVELWSVSRARLAEMAIEIWVMCQRMEKLFGLMKPPGSNLCANTRRYKYRRAPQKVKTERDLR